MHPVRGCPFTSNECSFTFGSSEWRLWIQCGLKIHARKRQLQNSPPKVLSGNLWCRLAYHAPKLLAWPGAGEHVSILNSLALLMFESAASCSSSCGCVLAMLFVTASSRFSPECVRIALFAESHSVSHRPSSESPSCCSRCWLASPSTRSCINNLVLETT